LYVLNLVCTSVGTCLEVPVILDVGCITHRLDSHAAAIGVGKMNVLLSQPAFLGFVAVETGDSVEIVGIRHKSGRVSYPIGSHRYFGKFGIGQCDFTEMEPTSCGKSGWAIGCDQKDIGINLQR